MPYNLSFIIFSKENFMNPYLRSCLFDYQLKIVVENSLFENSEMTSFKSVILPSIIPIIIELKSLYFIFFSFSRKVGEIKFLILSQKLKIFNFIRNSYPNKLIQCSIIYFSTFSDDLRDFNLTNKSNLLEEINSIYNRNIPNYFISLSNNFLSSRV